MGRHRTSPDLIKEALAKSGGNVAAAARALGMNRSSLFQRILRTPSLKEAMEDERETMVDVAESMLRKAVHEGDMTAIMYTLNNSPAAKRRGWGPRQEVTGADGDGIKVIIKYADA